ncbi:MAG: hypothetical protein A2117_01420 [Candidatus Wildermuthbacteria bacterium GWA2_46_15]|uniref:Uncharacterized protein n=1 Tax=Candidatus Wildermuthbacteria bacterium GWA2_46_15 TaxID=1802443 RepID=A0A1G2QQ50_9BACT|nr:MAG: hypothetical protein A2117_01420 [Candidatus Wildermuthbacteria bacterium GWA2_46_15]
MFRSILEQSFGKTVRLLYRAGEAQNDRLFLGTPIFKACFFIYPAEDLSSAQIAENSSDSYQKGK